MDQEQKQNPERDSEMNDLSNPSTKTDGGSALAEDSVVEGAPRADSTPEVDNLKEGLSKIGLKKLSGAQQKKLRKAQKIAAGTWTDKKPARAKKAANATGSKSEGKKRPRSDTVTPPGKITKKARHANPQTGSYSEAARGLSMAVIDSRHPEVTIDQGQADLIKSKLEEAVFNTPGGSSETLQFNKTTFHAGVLWMTCGNELTKNWLGQTVKGLGQIWQGADLKVVDAKDLPKRPIVLTFIPGAEKVDEESIRTRLSNQNRELKTADWILKNKKADKGGLTLTYSINEVSFGALQASQLKAYYGLGRVTFRVLRGIDGGDQGPSNKPAA